MIPRSFEGETLSDISIGPKTGVKTKNGKERNISIPFRIAQLFNQYHNSLRYKERLSLWLELEDVESERDHPALLNREGEIYNPNTINRYWSINYHVSFAHFIEKQGELKAKLQIIKGKLTPKKLATAIKKLDKQGLHPLWDGMYAVLDKMDI
ncbi:TPA: hypothetical protein N3B91_004495 [Vibrio parahaemolyticus]|nr:hypothetical protein [Vibrio parahaemolyticus]